MVYSMVAGGETDFISIPLWPELDLRLSARIVDAELAGQSRSPAFLFEYSIYVYFCLSCFYDCSVQNSRVLFSRSLRSTLRYSVTIFSTIFPHIFVATCPRSSLFEPRVSQLPCLLYHYTMLPSSNQSGVSFRQDSVMLTPTLSDQTHNTRKYRLVWTFSLRAKFFIENKYTQEEFLINTLL